jgi:hypothetical protein
MRLLLLRFAIAAASTLIVWVVAGSQLSMWLDRLGTVADVALPTGNYELDAEQFSIGPKRWVLGAGVTIANDERGRMTLSSNGRTFAFGAVDGGRGESPGAYFQFHPDPGDHIAFVQRRSALAWPTPFRISILGGKTPTWARHSYRQLQWTKASGASITMVWRDLQSFFDGTGWTDGNLAIAPVVTISAMPAERAVLAYVAKTRSWPRAEFRLEHRGPSADGACVIVAVLHADDARATGPGAGRSMQLCVDVRTSTVLREIASQ